MAHKRSSKKTSFGKKSEAEKSFLKRSRKSSTEEGKDGKRRSSSQFSRSTGRPFRSEGRSYGKPRGEGSENAEERPRRTYRKSGDDKPSFSKPGGFRRRSGDDNSSAGDFGKRPYRKSSDSGKPSYVKPGGFRKRSDDEKSSGDRFEKKPFRKSFNSDKPSFSKPGGFRKRSDDEKPTEGRFEKRTYRKSSDGDKPSFSKPGFRKRSSDKPFSSEGRRDDSGEGRSYRSSKALGFAKRSKSPSRRKESSTAQAPKQDDGLTRLNKYIANSGMGSRRDADEMIKKGLISVNGVTISEMGFKVKQGDEVRYEDKVLKAEKLVYVLLNKPKGFLTTTVDPKDRKTVMNLVASACKERLYPVGRLDRNTTGLLLLTNDGELAEKLTHPSYNTKKIYKVELDRALTKNDFQKILDGVYLEEGRAIVDELAYTDENKKEIGIELHIGWNRIVRRIFETLEYEVVKLDRVIFAGLDKKDLPRGEWRFLKPEEVVRLKHFK